ncbi:bifunctional diaminohydroxyphosphoribosylaminopyrimidine deaminase/5-amino-6-(5-phosphoribosylamino)uracil reductase RibD [Lewinella sp. 4G2]|uniref:bifunctional diaminohydroxyphosphoribosylaminopyrimidine deaminase/5-amino-6-(5-phosphoribosylamino)uracil reductase RibD n=1 Tax=Lewinella sp. 4G2 TaxID=1803372 RepID=UPI0007E09654|nr:bifunctional diaminohydroxyphosphoribosylaminopyrimidine deaminase/5-amino-6-(5-phosphoribosylamino)uracil reductase RibD [Lewinella sp. 4G2]OAV44487.1 riboflavin biosynthesis protein RibD [Lewinella sp. 4G2]
MNTDTKYLFRTAQLALLGDSRVLDSPRVGSVLVHGQKIIGEGYHQQAGKAHAEVNCLNSVIPENRHLISESTLYVSLEPCCIVGKTGACSTLILNHGIKRVVIGQRDSTPGVDGGSVELLRAAGVEVVEYPDFEPTRIAGQFRETLVTKHRPYVTLKYAQSADGYLRPADRAAEYWITNPISRRLVHRWRAGKTAVIVGARTVLDDNPSLTTRLWPGPSPRPVVIDPRGRLTGKEKVFSGPSSPIHYTSRPVELPRGNSVVMPNNLDKATLELVLQDLAERRLANVTVEGGAAILNTFLTSGLWDEAKVFTGEVHFGGGVVAPEPGAYGGKVTASYAVGSDRVVEYRNFVIARRPDLRSG